VQDREPDIIAQTISFWQERTEQPVSSEDARQMIANVAGFFHLLAEWDRQAHQDATSQKTPDLRTSLSR
jgi:hypothetical protein